MRLHRLFAVLFTLAAPSLILPSAASASTTDTAIDIAKTVTHHEIGDYVAYNSAAQSAAIDPTDMASTHDIVGTDLRFDTHLITLTTTTRTAPVIDDHNWLAASYSFNNSSLFDGLIVYGRLDPTGPVQTVAVNRIGIACHAMTTVTGNDVAMSVDAACMGHPGNVSYSVGYGDFYSALDNPNAVDTAPDTGFSAPVSERGGYWLLGGDGGMFAFGDAPFYGSTGNRALNKPVVSMSAMPDAGGYRFVASDGGIFAYGNAGFFGSMGGSHLNKPVVGMATTPSGNGYWLVASDGGVFAYGDALFAGSTGSIHLNKPIVSMQPTASGNGYWLVASDGGIFAYGDARFFGSTGGMTLNQPVAGMTATANGDGYDLLAADGGVFSFGNAPFYGSGAGRTYAAAVSIGFDHNGYLIADAAGGVTEIGDTYNFGDLVQLGVSPNMPVVGMAILPR